MKSASGTGTLVVNGREVPILYDLVQSREGASPRVVGQLFGDAEALHEAFSCPGLLLRLEGGHCTHVVLTNCETRGAADVRVSGAMPWE